MALMTEKELMEWTGYSRRADVERYLKLNHIPYTTGKGGRLLTALESVKQAHGVRYVAPAPEAPTPEEPDDFVFL